MIVDDSEIAREWVKEALEAHYNVAMADSAMTAGGIVTRAHPDLILLDVHMPALAGHEVVGTLRQRCRRDVPVVFFSGLPRETLERKVRESNASGFIEKGEDPETFRKRVEAYLSSNASPQPDVSNRKRVLVAGDRANLPSGALLKRGDMSIAFAGGLDELRDELAQRSPALLILGPDLSASDVISAIKEVRNNPDRRGLSILVLAGPQGEEHARSLISAGADKALVAPFSDAEFLVAVGDLLGVAPRLAARLIVRLEVKVDEGLDFRVGFSRNISRTGMLVELDGPVELGDELGLQFYVPDRNQEIRARARVVRIHDMVGKKVIAGVLYEGIADADAAAIHAWVESKMDAPET